MVQDTVAWGWGQKGFRTGDGGVVVKLSVVTGERRKADVTVERQSPLLRLWLGMCVSKIQSLFDSCSGYNSV